MDKVQKLLQFWGVLAFLIRAAELKEDGIKMLIELHREIDCGISPEEFTAEYLHELHRVYHSDTSTFEESCVLQEFVETGFEDLSRYLRIPRARTVFANLREMIDSDERDLFIRQINVRRLDDNPSGCAVVTLVVHDYEKFKAFLLNKDAVECVRYSDATT